MHHCIRTLLVTATLLTTLTPSVRACCFLPLLCPLNWCGALSHQNPYATRQIIDDWLGYGYLRGNANGSLGHYPMKPWNMYAPAYPALARPMSPAWGMPAPRFLPNPYPMQQPMWAAPNPGYMPMQPQMPFMAQGDDCGCGAPSQPLPMNNCLPECDPCQQMMAPMQVPITTYRPVTVDRGSYQMIWVPRPVTQMVPQTSWQQYYPQSQYQMAAPQFQPAPMQAPCNDCGGSSAVPIENSAYYQNSVPQMMAMSPTMTAPAMASSMIPAPAMNAWSPTTTWNAGTTSAARPQMHASPFSQFQQRSTPQIATGFSPMTAYGSPAMAYSPQSAGLVYGARPAVTAWNQAPQSSPYYGGQMAAVPNQYAWNTAAMPTQTDWQFSQGQTMAYPRVASDYMGDHEHPSTQIRPVPMTGSLPVMQNSFNGSVPLVRTGYVPSPGYAPSLRTTSSRKYSAAVR